MVGEAICLMCLPGCCGTQGRTVLSLLNMRIQFQVFKKTAELRKYTSIYGKVLFSVYNYKRLIIYKKME